MKLTLQFRHVAKISWNIKMTLKFRIDAGGSSSYGVGAMVSPKRESYRHSFWDGRLNTWMKVISLKHIWNGRLYKLSPKILFDNQFKISLPGSQSSGRRRYILPFTDGCQEQRWKQTKSLSKNRLSRAKVKTNESPKKNKEQVVKRKDENK